MTIAKMCQRVETDFVGARCGLMDPFAVTHGQPGRALQLDCRSLEWHRVPLPTDVQLVIGNTMVRHAHTTGGYNPRRNECESALAHL